MVYWLQRRAVRALTDTPLRLLAGPIYNGLVAAELRAARRRDALWRQPFGSLDRSTALVKTHERPHACKRLLESLRRLHPGLKIVVVDDSRAPRDWPGARSIKLPYDAGASVGRNEGLAQIDTEFVISFDDDFVAFRGTDLSRPLGFLDAHAGVDLVGGCVIDLPLYRRTPDARDRTAFNCTVREIGGLPVYGRVPQFFVARTRRVASVGWDARLKTAEHTDFFRRLFDAGIVTVYDEGFEILHAQTRFDRAYMRKRNDVAPYIEILERESRERAVNKA
jgi:hypothetical protein